MAYLHVFLTSLVYITPDNPSGFSFTGCLSVKSLGFFVVIFHSKPKSKHISLVFCQAGVFLPGRRSCYNWIQKYSSSQFSMIQRFRSEGSYFRSVTVMGALGLSSRFNVIRKLRVCRYQEVYSCISFWKRKLSFIIVVTTYSAKKIH